MEERIYRIYIDINDGLNTPVTIPLDYSEIEVAKTVFDTLAWSDTVIDARMFILENGHLGRKLRELSEQDDY